MWNVDPYLQTQWQLTEKLSLDAGVRYSSVWFDSNDYYITPGNDDSGEASYHKWLPAGSLKYAVTDAWNVYSPPAAVSKRRPLMNSPTAPATRAG
jgi:iron complex outermembrane receptor protein